MTDDTPTTDGTIEFSRRRLLGSAAVVGTAAALGGAGSTAFFSDTEQFANNRLVAGSLDVKAAYSAHYSDWSPDEDGRDTDSPDDDVDVRMWDGPRGTTGSPDDLATGETGLPTNAAWLVAVDDPGQFLENTQYRSDGDASCPGGTDADGLAQPVVDLEDVKPGDFGEVTVEFAICDNPGYVWLDVFDATAAENGYTEPERTDDDESGPVTGPEGGETDRRVELLDVVQTAYWIDDEAPAAIGSLREMLTDLSGGVRLDGDVDASEGGGTGEQGCFSAGTTHSIAVAWWVPVDHGNEIQTDSVSFSLGLYAEQCRHNDGIRDPLDAFLNDDAVLKEGPIWNGSVVDATGQDEVVVENNALTSVDLPGLPPQLPLAYDPQVVRVSPDTTVEWNWTTYGDEFPPSFDHIPHNVVALDGSFDSGAPEPAASTDAGFSHTFTTPGVHLYYCTPHGAPFFVPSSPGTPFDEVLNEFGMRGAVIVSD
jgi:predicted ribosomally synthesized peptide with SipW-like signal peptide